MPISVLIAEKNSLMRKALSGTLTALGYTVVGQTASGAEVATLVEQHVPNVLLLDVNLIDEGISKTEMARLKEQFVGLKIVILTLCGLEDFIHDEEPIDFANGFWDKYDGSDGLLKILGVTHRAE